MELSRRKLLITLVAGPNGDRASIAFTLANASLSAGMEVLVFLTSDGVELAREGSSDLVHVRPFRPLAELMEEFVTNSGKLLVCGSCMQFRGLEHVHLRHGAQVGGVASVVAYQAEGAQTLAF